MAEDIEEIRRQKLAELRNKAETGGSEASTSKSPSEPIHIDGGAELSETVAEYGLVLPTSMPIGVVRARCSNQSSKRSRPRPMRP